MMRAKKEEKGSPFFTQGEVAKKIRELTMATSPYITTEFLSELMTLQLLLNRTTLLLRLLLN